MLLSPSSPVERRAAVATGVSSVSTTQTSPNLQPSLRSPDGTLRLRGGPIEDRRVRWDQDVVDNEGMGKKSSKVCCIYARPRAYDESSSEEDSSSDESSSDESDDSANHNHHNHNHSRCGGRGHGHKKASVRRKNAYEKMPKPSSGLKRQT
ncbi:phosphatase inhibitor-domain-containing protein [Tricharina praecox]|uniref:phosphatase inhibitor-domain-containing protein n=1 Tax=Tricharina praecox TaxID=43433 RepID=UPI00221F4BE9|nr:phosphatase inhibitor-domain-containing protein [Tricharina praecox]KAI5857131.1 phosphatase inhibitor-domain-containing protein [Tricharina praecox]